MHLMIGGVDVVEIAQREGTPLWILDEDNVKQQLKAISEAFSDVWPQSRIAYAVKANPLTAVCEIVRLEGGWGEVVSEGELNRFDVWP